MSEARGRILVFFSWAWRLAIFVLPWQTRWFHAVAGAVPSEIQEWSVWASWIPILCAIVLGFWSTKKRPSPPFLLSLCLFILLTFAATFDVRATAQWWIQILLLAAFGWTLFVMDVSWRDVATWCVISLVPHVALGMWQYASQEIVAIKWFGIASQLPQNLGVSVIEAGPFRTLRAYGGFPHPNIFGGWLAIGCLLALVLARDALTKTRAVLWTIASSAIAVTLFLTFSRGAWIAATVGVVCITIRSRRSQFFRVALVSSLVAVCIIGFSQQELFFSRLSSTGRLEQKSIETRLESFRFGWQLVRQLPFFGTGPNAELQGRGKLFANEQESPHNVFLLALVDVGIIGVLFFGWCIWRIVRKAATSDRLFWFVPLSILGLFDHFLWSYWSGQALVTLTILFLLTANPRPGTVATDIV